jgi:hypothetical protein
MDKIIYGADTETVNGEPNTLQFYSEDNNCSDIYFVNKSTALKTFLKWCEKRRRGSLHVVYIHNLKFDLIELLYGSHHKLIENGGNFEFAVNDWSVTGVYGTPTFAVLSKGHNLTIQLIDSFSFYRGSLASAADLFCPDLPKLKRPRDLGQHRITAKDTAHVEYAMRDAVISYHIGKSIEAIHNEFDIRQTVSVADLSATIFRHAFLDYTIPQPSQDIVSDALDSYHGGKNNLTVGPGWYREVTSIDLKSAYPGAMHKLPAFSDSRLYKRYKPTKSRIGNVPDYGVYSVSGNIRVCAWPVLFAHDFVPLQGDIQSVCVHGLELNEALRSGEFKPTRIEGSYYDAEKDNQVPAMRNFVEHFYKLKESEPDKVKRYMYKVILNSLYGKFIQTRKRSLKCYVDIDSGKMTEASELVAGGMFHPFIASAITADCRARIHKLEHDNKALHTATDGIFTQLKKPKGVKAHPRIGEAAVDAKGDLLLVRNKLYILYGPNGTFDSRSFEGKKIIKYALHGFQGTVWDLERLVSTGRRKYKANHVNQLRESIKRGLQPNLFVERDYNLKVGPLKVKG